MQLFTKIIAFSNLKLIFFYILYKKFSATKYPLNLAEACWRLKLRKPELKVCLFILI